MSIGNKKFFLSIALIEKWKNGKMEKIFISAKIKRHLKITKRYELFMVIKFKIKKDNVKIGLASFVLMIFASKIKDALVVELNLIWKELSTLNCYYRPNNQL